MIMLITVPITLHYAWGSILHSAFVSLLLCSFSVCLSLCLSLSLSLSLSIYLIRTHTNGYRTSQPAIETNNEQGGNQQNNMIVIVA